MATTQTAPQVQETSTPKRRLSALDIVMLVGAASETLVAVGGQVASGRIIPPEMGFAVVGLISVIVVATGWRWNALVPLVLLSLIGIGGLANGFPEYAAVRPADYVPFSSIILQYAAILMVDVAAVVKLTRRPAPTMPAWLAQGIGVLAGLVLGALLIGAAAQPVSGSGATAKETVHLTPLAFAPDTVSVHTGDSLTVIDDSPTPHILANGTWTDSNKPAPGAEPGAPTISNVELNNSTVKIGPFPTAGVYHIYCTVHPGMSLTVVVQ